MEQVEQPTNGNGAETETLVRCESCEAVMPIGHATPQTKGALAGKLAHLVAIHQGYPGKGVRPCGPVYRAWIYWVAYKVRRPGQAEITEAGSVSFDAPITHPLQLVHAQEQLAEAEGKKLKAVDLATGADLLGAPLPEVRVTGYELLRAI